MSFETFTAALNCAEFPFISNFFNRAVIVPGYDNPPKVPRSATSVENVNPEIGQHYYLENVIPTAEGLMSVGYMQIVPLYNPSTTDFDQAITLRDVDENNFIFSPANGKNYIYRLDAGAWAPKNSFVGWTEDLVTRSFVNGRTFICYQKKNIYEYDAAADTFLPVPFTSPVVEGATVAISEIDGIGSSNNYLLWWKGIIVGWSSLIDPTDLVPNINTGAGFAIPQDVKGPIRAIVPVAGGFIIYTTKNAVAALYTNNARAPFVFREISNAGGIQLPEQVTLEASLGFQYAWTTAGLQKISINGAESLNPAATDFLAGRIYESFDYANKLLTVQKLNASLKVKISYISGRYLLVSYGVPATPQIYTYVLVYDLSMKRWGKLRVDHVDCFYYPYPNVPGFVTETPPKLSIGFLQKDGTVLLLLMDYREKSDNGVILLGQYQLVRQKVATFQSVELDMLDQAYPPAVYLMISTDGKNLQPAQALALLRDTGNAKKYGAPVYSGAGAAPQRTGINFSSLILGTFQLSTAMFVLTRHGNR